MHHVKQAAYILAVVAIVAIVQSQFKIPVVGKYLPGGGA